MDLLTSDCAGPSVAFYEQLLTILGVVNPTVTENIPVVGEAGCARAGCFVSGQAGQCVSELIIDADPVSYVDDASPFSEGVCGDEGFTVRRQFIPQVECIKRCFIPPNIEVVYGSCL